MDVNSVVKVEIKFHLECKLHFPSAQLMLRQMHLRNVYNKASRLSTEFVDEVLTLTSVNTSYENCP